MNDVRFLPHVKSKNCHNPCPQCPHSPILRLYSTCFIQMDLFSHSSMTKPPFQLRNEKPRAFSIQLTPIYSMENRFISSVVENFATKHTRRFSSLTIRAWKRMCDNKENESIHRDMAQRSTQYPSVLFLFMCVLVFSHSGFDVYVIIIKSSLPKCVFTLKNLLTGSSNNTVCITPHFFQRNPIRSDGKKKIPHVLQILNLFAIHYLEPDVSTTQTAFPRNQRIRITQSKTAK